MNLLTNKILKHFLLEITEIYNRYLLGKKPTFFPYNKKANTLEEMVDLSIKQMFSVTNHLKTYSSWKHRKSELSFEQWIVYQLITSSLKGIKEDILRRVKLMDEKSKTCEHCGRELKNFMHNCPHSNNMPEIYGCPKCDDECTFCKEDYEEE